MPTNFLRDRWYQAAFADELSDRPLARTLLNIPVVLWRGAGNAVALLDRCPHRFAPLSTGSVRDGLIVCGYHGLAFDGSGRCQLNPHGAITSTMGARSFPVIERHAAIWIWTGDAELADPALIPDLSFIDQTPTTARITFHIPICADYRLVTDNLMDLSHADFLHPTTLGGVMTGVKPKTAVRNGSVSVEWVRKGCLAPARFHNRVPPPQRADAWTRAVWQAPAVLVIRTALVPSGAERRREDEVWALHSMTPETETTTHYFVCGTRAERTDDLAYSERLRAMLAHAFLEEDKPMLEAQQQRIGAIDLPDLGPALLPIDAGAVLVRRELKRLIEAELDAGNDVPEIMTETTA